MEITGTLTTDMCEPASCGFALAVKEKINAAATRKTLKHPIFI
jgi:hypothetical protein